MTVVGRRGEAASEAAVPKVPGQVAGACRGADPLARAAGDKAGDMEGTQGRGIVRLLEEWCPVEAQSLCRSAIGAEQAVPFQCLAAYSPKGLPSGTFPLPAWLSGCLASPRESQGPSSDRMLAATSAQVSAPRFPVSTRSPIGYQLAPEGYTAFPAPPHFVFRPEPSRFQIYSLTPRSPPPR